MLQYSAQASHWKEKRKIFYRKKWVLWSWQGATETKELWFQFEVPEGNSNNYLGICHLHYPYPASHSILLLLLICPLPLILPEAHWLGAMRRWESSLAVSSNTEHHSIHWQLEEALVRDILLQSAISGMMGVDPLSGEQTMLSSDEIFGEFYCQQISVEYICKKNPKHRYAWKLPKFGCMLLEGPKSEWTLW